MNNSTEPKYYEGWNKGKDLTPDDLVVLHNKVVKGYKIYLKIQAPAPFYNQKTEKLHTKYFMITCEEEPTEKNIRNTKLDLCGMLIDNFEKIKKHL